MPLRWIIKSDERLFEVICDGLVEVAEVHEMLDVLVGAKALGYRKLFDGSHGETSMGAMDVLNIGVRIRALHAGNLSLGPVAVVAPDDKYLLLSRVLGILAAPKRPMKIFKDLDKARDWLNSPAVLSHIAE